MVNELIYSLCRHTAIVIRTSVLITQTATADNSTHYAYYFTVMPININADIISLCTLFAVMSTQKNTKWRTPHNSILNLLTYGTL
jgi:hypothetical protein